MSAQLERLARPFPAKYVAENPSGGGSYVKHSVVNEKLLAVLGPFDFQMVEVIRGYVGGIEPDPNGKSRRAREGRRPLDDAVVGVVARLTAEVDGRLTMVEEAGDCEDPHNWPHDGARLKDAMSDALKRCAMRFGVGLHMWSDDQFTLYDQLRTRADAPTPKRNYASWGKDELVAECAARGLDTSGVKETLAAQLLANDVEMQKPFVEAAS